VIPETPQIQQSDQVGQSLLSKQGPSEQIFYDLLEMMGFLVMERISATKFHIFGQIPDWLSQIFDLERIDEVALDPQDLSPFFDDFATIADQFWSESASGMLKSGPWTETDKSGLESYLELSAVNLGGRKIMLLQLLGEDYHKKKDLLQRFREKGLDYEILFKTQQALNRAHDLLRKQAAKLKELSLEDPLTGLNNRRGFLTLAEHQIKIAESNDSTLILLYMDLNNFKQINDTLGHAEGDKLLIAAADLFRNTFRRSDIIGKLGGDEFVVLVTDENDSSEDFLRKRLEKGISEFNSNPGLNYGLSTSLGVAVWRPDAPCTLKELLSQSDNSMYQDKKRSRQLR
jgi:diguanylate cyclase (GGDEF)-like protein